MSKAKEKTYSRMQLIELALEWNKSLKRSKLLQLTEFLDWLKEHEEDQKKPRVLPGQRTIDEEIREVEHETMAEGQ